MKIYIPSKGRANKQLTLGELPGKLLEETSLVIYPQETESYRRWGIPLIRTPQWVKELGSKRQFIFEQHNVKRHGYKFVIIDDDIGQFATRRVDEPTKFYRSQPDEVLRLFWGVEALLDYYPMVGVLGREGANRVTEPVVFCVRMMRFLAFNAKVLHKHDIKFNRAAAPMDDFDVHLQLLRLGYKTACVANFCQDQASSGSAGGCSEWRAAHPNAEAAEGLRQLHPDYVKLVNKTTKTAWGGGTRVDVQVAWKKAYAAGAKQYAR